MAKARKKTRKPVAKRGAKKAKRKAVKLKGRKVTKRKAKRAAPKNIVAETLELRRKLEGPNTFED